MRDFWRVKKSLALVSLTCREVSRLVASEWSEVRRSIGARLHGRRELVPPVRSVSVLSLSQSSRKPLVFVSACVDRARSGGWKFNGGIKEYNILVKLLRQKGYDAYLVTYDGTYEEWLVDHQPCVSIGDFKAMVRTASVRCVTSWPIASAFVEIAPLIYFWDMELRYSDNEHFAAIWHLYRSNKIRAAAAISRTVQGWHMARFGRKCNLLPNLNDSDVWKPIPTEEKDPACIGFMDEGPHSDSYVRNIDGYLENAGIEHRFVKVSGSEARVLELMQKCTFFVSLNLGKDPFWGEGCPRTIIESLAAGCVSISFDVLGNREIILDGFNGYILAGRAWESMAAKLAELLTNRAEVERVLRRSSEVLDACHALDKRWPTVKSFLELE